MAQKEYTQLRIEKSAKPTVDEAKRDDETYTDFALRCADAEPNVQEVVDAADVAGDVADAVVAQVADDLVARVVDGVVAELDGDLGGSGDGSLDASERRKIAEEVAEVLR